MPSVETIRGSLLSLQEEYPITRAHLFGSYAEGRQTEASDVDLLVEFREESVSLLTLSSLKLALEERLGRPVDLLHAPLPEGAMIAPGKVVELL